MKALLLAGGFGTRLRPLTYTRPKHLLPILNRAHIEHVFDLLVRHGVTDIILTTSYLAGAFATTVERARERGIRVDVTHEEVPLGTAGALKNAEAAIGNEAFLVFNGDILTDVDLQAVVDFHKKARAEATILLTPVEDPSTFGVVPTDDAGRVTAFIEKPPAGQAPTNLINAGVYVLEPSVLKRIPAGREWSVERGLFPELVTQGAPLYALATDAYWNDVGTPEKYLQVNLDAIAARVRVAEGAAVAAGAQIDDQAEVSAACVGSGCTIEAGARVTESVLLPGVTVGHDAAVTGSILGQGVVVAPGAEVVGRTVADGDRVG
ncbi:MAG: NDP-sugar synthase [Actinomycetota bacterium]|nr:NDP-sugar synthase [Actinomycetota bacterium]